MRAAIRYLLAASVMFLSTFAMSDDRDKAVTMLQDHSASLQSYDIVLKCTQRLMLDASGEREVIVDGRTFKIPIERILPASKAKVSEHTYRQVYLKRGRFAQPLRRIEELDGSGKTISILAFDGDVRRVYYAWQNGGLVGGPPDGAFMYVLYNRDYFTLCGRSAPQIETPLADIAAELPADDVEVRRDTELTLVHLKPADPQNAASYGYRMWLDSSHGNVMRRFQQYAYTPDKMGQRDEHISREIVVSDVHNAGDRWVPVRATVTEFVDRGELVGQASSQTEIEVDVTRSSWECDPASDAFTFDFPRGTRVQNTLVGMTLVVGDKDAGRNLNQLVADARSALTHDPSTVRVLGEKSGGLTRRILLGANVVILVSLVFAIVVRYRRLRVDAHSQ